MRLRLGARAGVREPAEVPSGRAAPHGYVDAIVRGEVRGWCWRPDDPAERLEVEVFVDGEKVSGATADQLRESVAHAGIGDGRYGFNAPLPGHLADARSHRIRVLAEGVHLKFSPSFGHVAEPDEPWALTPFEPELPELPEADADAVEVDVDTSAAAAEEREPEIRGYVDGIIGDEIRGWVVDQGDSGRQLDVEAYLDGVFIGSKKADEERADVAGKGFGAAHGFRFKLPTPVTPGEYLVEVRTYPERFRVPLITDYKVLDHARTPVEGVSLREPSVGRTVQASQTLLGSDGWIFEWPGMRVFQILRGEQLMPRPVFERQLERIVGRRDAAQAAGITLLEAVVPSKLAVYPDLLPGGLEVFDSGRPAGELAAALNDENGVELLDLTVSLRQARSRGLIFSRTSRGLTWLGGFSAYRVLAKELAKRGSPIDPLPVGSLKLGQPEAVPDSLADLPRLVWVGLGTVPAGPAVEDEEREGQPRLDWAGLGVEYAVIPAGLASDAGRGAAMLVQREPGVRPDALVVHDGAAATIIPFLAHHFERTLVVEGEADIASLMARLEPRVLVEVVSERSLLVI